MDSRAARRAAEKAARDLINDRAALVGELGVAQAERAQLLDDVVTAAERGRQLVATAEAEAAHLLEHAQAAVRDAEQRYADVYGAATAAGWASADLSALGFSSADSPGTARRRPRPPVARTASSAPASPAGASLTTTQDVAVPQQPNQPDSTAVTATPA